WQIGKSALDVAGATVALAAPISTPPPASMILSASEPRETPPTMIAVVENRASRERCVMIASKHRRDGLTCFTQMNTLCRAYMLVPRMSRDGPFARRTCGERARL